MKLQLSLILLSLLCLHTNKMMSSERPRPGRAFTGDTTLEGSEKHLAKLREDRAMVKDIVQRRHIDEMIKEQEAYVNRLKGEGNHHPTMR